MLDNFDNLQASWVTQGGKVGQLSLAFGANDMGSVMIEENVVRAAGASYCMDEVEIVRNVEDAGFVAKRRNMHYDILGDPFFREREVPRMLELATAREAGDTSVPAELVNYPARSAAGKRQRSQPPDLTGRMTRVPGGVGLPDRSAADPGRHRRDRRRADRGGRAQDTPGADADRHDLGRRRAVLPGPGQRAHPSRAVVAARPRAAGAEVHRLGEDAVRDSRRGPSSVDDAEQVAPIREAIAELQRHRHGRGRRHQQLAGRRRSDARGRPRRRRLSRAARFQGTRRRAGRVDRGRCATPAAADGVRVVAGAARAVFDVARAVQGDSRRR